MNQGARQPHIALVGPGGAVGTEYLTLLAERQVPAEHLRLVGHTQCEPVRLDYRGHSLEIETLDAGAFEGIEFAFFATDSELSREWCPIAANKGATVIDNSSAFRSSDSVPLVVPEVNSEILTEFSRPGIVAVPNCTTIITLMAVAPIHRAVGISRMQLATYQAISGAGGAALRELHTQTREHVAGDTIRTEVLPSQSLFNVFSHESRIDETGFNGEERKIREESRRILGTDGLEISATCMRVGVPRAHLVAITLELCDDLDVEQAARLVAAAPGVRLVDDRTRNRFPEPLEASGTDEVLVGRFRNDPDRGRRGMLLLACGDQLRPGAALSGIQLMERLATPAQNP